MIHVCADGTEEEEEEQGLDEGVIDCNIPRLYDLFLPLRCDVWSHNILINAT